MERLVPVGLSSKREARRTGEKVAAVAALVFVPLYNYEMTDLETARQTLYKDRDESRGYRRAVEGDYT